MFTLQIKQSEWKLLFANSVAISISWTPTPSQPHLDTSTSSRPHMLHAPVNQTVHSGTLVQMKCVPERAMKFIIWYYHRHHPPAPHKRSSSSHEHGGQAASNEASGEVDEMDGSVELAVCQPNVLCKWDDGTWIEHQRWLFLFAIQLAVAFYGLLLRIKTIQMDILFYQTMCIPQFLRRLKNVNLIRRNGFFKYVNRT